VAGGFVQRRSSTATIDDAGANVRADGGAHAGANAAPDARADARADAGADARHV